MKLQKKVKGTKAQEEAVDDEQADSSGDENELSSDEDEIDEDGQMYLERLQKKVQQASPNAPFAITATIQQANDDDDSDDDYDGMEETSLETYTTPLDDDNCPVDEYVAFKDALLAIERSNPAWYAMLTSHLTAEQNKSVMDLFQLADQKRAAAESRRIEQSGGYVFQAHQVPTTFNFGGNFG